MRAPGDFLLIWGGPGGAAKNLEVSDSFCVLANYGCQMVSEFVYICLLQHVELHFFPFQSAFQMFANVQLFHSEVSSELLRRQLASSVTRPKCLGCTATSIRPKTADDSSLSPVLCVKEKISLYRSRIETPHNTSTTVCIQPTTPLYRAATS